MIDRQTLDGRTDDRRCFKIDVSGTVYLENVRHLGKYIMHTREQGKRVYSLCV